MTGRGARRWKKKTVNSEEKEINRRVQGFRKSRVRVKSVTHTDRKKNIILYPAEMQGSREKPKTLLMADSSSFMAKG